MEKVLRYFTDDALYFFKANKEEFCKLMQENPHSTEWIADYYGKDPMVNSNYKFDFEFQEYNKKTEEMYDIKNAIALYELFEKHNIGPATIYNEKFLSGFIFTFGYEYFMNVMGADQVTHVFATLFFEDGVRRAVVRNTIGRLYRYVEMTIDDNLPDRYEITKFAFQNPALFRIKYNTNVDGENTTRALYKAFREWSYETHKPPVNKMVEAVKRHLSVLANVSELDLVNEKELVNTLKKYIYSIDK